MTLIITTINTMMIIVVLFSVVLNQIPFRENHVNPGN